MLKKRPRGHFVTLIEICVHLIRTLVREDFLEQRGSGQDKSQSGEKRKTSDYLGLESHFHADARVRI